MNLFAPCLTKDILYITICVAAVILNHEFYCGNNKKDKTDGCVRIADILHALADV